MGKPGRLAIVGIAESEFGKVPHKTAFQLHAEAARAAVADAGLRPSEIDGLFSAGAREGMHIISIGEYLGLKPRFADSTQIGGSAWELFIQHAMAAFSTGRCETALLVYASTSASDVKRGLRSETSSAAQEAPTSSRRPTVRR